MSNQGQDTVKSGDSEVFRAGLVIIGNEILSGRTHDANTPWIAERLTERGIVLAEVRVVPDEEAEIVRAVNDLRARFDYVFTTGGIGPTHDDITAASIAAAFGAALEENPQARRILEEHYGADDLTDARLKMAQAPVGAQLIPNPVSAAPGFVMGNVYVMAGVPRIMQAMFDHIIDTIRAGRPILSSTVTCGLPESVMAADMTALQERYPALQIGSYPHFRAGDLGLSVVLRGTDRGMLACATDELIVMIRRHGEEPRAVSMSGAEE